MHGGRDRSPEERRSRPITAAVMRLHSLQVCLTTRRQPWLFKHPSSLTHPLQSGAWWRAAIKGRGVLIIRGEAADSSQYILYIYIIYLLHFWKIWAQFTSLLIYFYWHFSPLKIRWLMQKSPFALHSILLSKTDNWDIKAISFVIFLSCWYRQKVKGKQKGITSC